MIDNEIIAKFMGAKIFKEEYGGSGACNRTWRIDTIHGNQILWPHEMEYATSMDWLMPVFDKIESLGYDTAICGVVINGQKLTEVLISPLRKKNGSIEVHQRTEGSKIKVAYDSVVLFIRTINPQ